MTPVAESAATAVSTPRVAFRTFGCKLNLYESAGMAQATRRLGFQVVEADDDVDVVVVNTCSVTLRADQEARQFIRRVHRLNPRIRVVVTGCYAQRAPQDLAVLPGVALIAGHMEKDSIDRLLQELPAPGQPPRIAVGSLAQAPMPALRAVGLEGRTRAMLRVQDGCDAACTYCVIPQTRGKSNSLPVEDALDEARKLLDAGYREIVLTGTHLGHYGIDLQPRRRRLSELVEALIALPAAHRFRIRLSSIEPQEIDERLIDCLAGSEVLAPHLHLPLQSGSDAMLRRMRRAYRTPAYRKQVERVARRVSPLALGADLIVGFPGETEADFRETLSFLGDLPFTYLHPFTFSPRPGTPAATWGDRPPGDMASRRLASAASLIRAKQRAFRAEHVGESVRVLAETHDDGVLRGLSGTYLTVRFPGDEAGLERFTLVRVTGMIEDQLIGERIEAPASTPGRLA